MNQINLCENGTLWLVIIIAVAVIGLIALWS